MKVLYRGFRIIAGREQGGDGVERLYYSAMRLRDCWFYKDDFHMGDYGTVREVVNEMYAHVDLLLDYPEEVEEDCLPPELRDQREQEWWDEKGPEDEKEQAE